MPFKKLNATAFRELFLRYAFRGAVGLSVATPTVAIFQGWYFLSDFRKNHRDAPFPDMPCSGVVVVLPQDKQVLSNPIHVISTPPKTMSSSSWFSSFPLLSEQKEPDPLRLLVVGDSLAAGVGVTKSGTPVLPEAIAKTLSSALGGRAVYWTCMGEPGLSSPQIVKELLLADEEAVGRDGKNIDVMRELKEWWDDRRKKKKKQEEETATETQDICEGPTRVKAWWRRVREGARKDLKDLRERLKISEKIPEPAVVLPRRRNTVVPDLVAEYDVAVVITGFNDLKNLIFPLPEVPNEVETPTRKQRRADEKDGVSSNAWLEKDLLSIMRALRGRMRNYGLSNDGDEDKVEAPKNGAMDSSKNSAQPASSVPHDADPDTSPSRRHHPMVVFPAAPLYVEKVYPLQWFAVPGVKIMEYQKRKLAEKYPAPVLFLEAPDDKAIKDFTNKRGPLWEARSREEVLFELTNKARLEQLETLMQEYYDHWTVDVEDEEATLTYDAFGPDIRGPMQHLEQRSPLLSPDRVHPSDEGYELWGRHIASAIVKEWDRVDKRDNR